MRKKLLYKEGDWFVVPLESGGYAIGRISRMTKNKFILLGYFFGPKFIKIPELKDLEKYSFEDAIFIHRFSYLGFKNEEWKILGHIDDWEKKKWPVPAFYRKDPLSKDHHRRIIYSDTDVNEEILEESVPYEMVKDLPEDGLAGYKYIEEKLNSLLK